jgi:hypothetical protein
MEPGNPSRLKASRSEGEEKIGPLRSEWRAGEETKKTQTGGGSGSGTFSSFAVAEETLCENSVNHLPKVVTVANGNKQWQRNDPPSKNEGGAPAEGRKSRAAALGITSGRKEKSRMARQARLYK